MLNRLPRDVHNLPGLNKMDLREMVYYMVRNEFLPGIPGRSRRTNMKKLLIIAVAMLLLLPAGAMACGGSCGTSVQAQSCSMAQSCSTASPSGRAGCTGQQSCTDSALCPDNGQGCVNGGCATSAYCAATGCTNGATCQSGQQSFQTVKKSNSGYYRPATVACTGRFAAYGYPLYLYRG